MALVLGGYLLTTNSVQAQLELSPMDTILTQSAFLGNTFYLQGKPMDLSVMRWFMSDYPAPYQQIRMAVLTDQLSIAGYGLGGLFVFSGLFVYEDNLPLARELLRTGGISIGSGLLLQFLSGIYQRKAARLYNREIVTAFEQKKAVSMRVEWEGAEVRLVVRW